MLNREIESIREKLETGGRASYVRSVGDRTYIRQFVPRERLIILGAGHIAQPLCEYVCVVTRGHRWDGDCLREIFRGEQPSYLGMIGSRRRVAGLFDLLKEEGMVCGGYMRVLIEDVSEEEVVE